MSKDAGSRRAALEERIRLAEQDLADLAIQVGEGELAQADAAHLENRYRTDLDAALTALNALPAGEKAAAPRKRGGDSGRTAPVKAPGRSGLKVLAVAVAAMVVLTIGIVVIAQGGGDDEATATTAPPASTDSLAELVAAVEAQPDNNPMRLALAGRYFEAGDYMEAMNHYSTVTAGDPTAEEASVANARIGWMAYSALGDPVTALQFLDMAIEQDPLYGEAKLWKGVVLLYGMNDGPAAVPFLEEVLQMTDLPEALRPEVEIMLQEALGGSR